jgi:O-antigen ligase
VLTAGYLRFGTPLGREGGGRGAILFAGAAIAALSALVSGSRAGLAGLVAVLVLFVAMLLAAGANGPRRGRSKGFLTNPGARLLVAGLAALVALGAVIGLFVLFDAIPALDRIAQKGIGDEMRAQLWPVIVEMLRTYNWAGIGFGAFEEAYHIHEPVALMAPQYVNQAHNDLAQFVIEGGVAGLAMVGLAAGWVLRTALRRRGGSMSAVAPLYWFGVVLVLVSASAVDYPLRTPLMQLIAMFLLLAFAATPPASGTGDMRSDDGTPGKAR